MQAISHPYFEEMNEKQDEIETRANEYPELNSPLFASNNVQRKQLNKKDSCIDFKMGK